MTDKNLILEIPLPLGSMVVSPTIDLSGLFEIAYTLSVQSIESTDSQVLVRLERLCSGVWRAEQTSRLLGSGTSTWYYPTGDHDDDMRIVLICINGSSVVSLSLVERPISEKPSNYSLVPFGIIHVDSEQNVTELPPPTGPNLYLGTDSLGQFGYHLLPTVPGSGVSISWNEIPVGVIDGTNRVFVLSLPPISTNSMMLYLNGMLLAEGVDFYLTGKTITYDLEQIPEVGDRHRVTYQYA